MFSCPFQFNHTANIMKCMEYIKRNTQKKYHENHSAQSFLSEIFIIQFFNLNSHHTTFCCRPDYKLFSRSLFWWHLQNNWNGSIIWRCNIFYTFHSSSKSSSTHSVYTIRLKKLTFSGWFSFWTIIHINLIWMNVQINIIYIPTYLLIILKISIGRTHRVSIYLYVAESVLL